MFLGESCLKARIYRSSSREFVCKLSDGRFITAKALGNLLKGDLSLLVTTLMFHRYLMMAMMMVSGKLMLFTSEVVKFIASP